MTAGLGFHRCLKKSSQCQCFPEVWFQNYFQAFLLNLKTIFWALAAAEGLVRWVFDVAEILF